MSAGLPPELKKASAKELFTSLRPQTLPSTDPTGLPFEFTSDGPASRMPWRPVLAQPYPIDLDGLSTQHHKAEEAAAAAAAA
jgi:hypothetical protein